MSEKFSVEDLKKILDKNPDVLPDDAKQILDELKRLSPQESLEFLEQCLDKLELPDLMKLDSIIEEYCAPRPRMMIVVVRRLPKGGLPRDMDD